LTSLASFPDSDLRLEIYVKPVNLLGKEQSVPNIPKGDLKSLLNQYINQKIFLVDATFGFNQMLVLASEYAWYDNFIHGKMVSRSTYLFPVALLLSDLQKAESCLVSIGDEFRQTNFPTIRKARLISHPGMAFLAPLHLNRHFQLMNSVSQNDRPWKAKENKLVWRGAYTGLSKEKLEVGNSRKHIRDLSQKFKLDPKMDIGVIQHLVANDHRNTETSEFRFPLSQREQLFSKYLLSLEGNDVASGLKWMMLSNSCVLMPNPIIESWFCESLLEPWVHYVPVASDLSDVEEKLEWCLSNDQDAEKIAQRGSIFATQFQDRALETELFRSVIKVYTENPRISELIQLLKEEFNSI
jgi:hypothetical protein